MSNQVHAHRSLGLPGATSVGVGAIVGGGILALAGVAFATTGPGAILAFALNGLIALLTALSFAELATSFPESGGTYTFAKRILSVEAAFVVGWVVWFASIVAGVLYSLGFGYFAALVIANGWSHFRGPSPPWLTGGPVISALAVVAIAFYTLRLLGRSGGGGGHWENAGKLAVFAVVIAAGLWAVVGQSVDDVRTSISPLFPGGAVGLFQAMGFTFIALQGFDLIAAVGGEVRDPGRTIPRAMFLSLAIALAVYLPLLFAVAVAGVEPGESITAASAKDPEGIIATAAMRFLGPFGFWLVIVAGLLSMLSALRANLFAASRVALAMARDRTLPHRFSTTHPTRGTPVTAVLVTALIMGVTAVALPSVAAAGAAASLIFLITFALAHWISFLARRWRAARPIPFRAPFFPLVPIAGTIICLTLAAYQGVSVPTAGFIAAAWLGVGGILFLGLFARPARVVDASMQAQDPELSRLRGRSPLVLLPIANPHNAGSMIAVANALTPPGAGKVLLLSVAVLPKQWQAGESVLAIRHAQTVLGDAMSISVRRGLLLEAMATVAADPWREIARIAREHRCDSVLLGFSELKPEVVESPLDKILGSVACDVVILRARPGWTLAEAGRVLVPVSGRSWHDRLRSRLLGSLFRTGDRQVTFLRVLPPDASKETCRRVARDLRRIAEEEAPGRSEAKVVQHAVPLEAIAEHATDCDLVVLGVQRVSRRHKLLGNTTLRIAGESPCPVLIISHRG